MKTLRYFLIIVLAFAAVSCTSRKDDMEKISALEKEVYPKDQPMNKEKAAELIKLYSSFADKYKSDSLAPGCLFKAAELSINLSNGEGAIKYFERLIEEYPDYKRVPDAYFVKSFVYEVLLKNINKAREGYSAFLEKFPDHVLANDARVSLNNLGKTPEQILLEAREKAKADSLAQLRKADSIAKIGKKKH